MVLNENSLPSVSTRKEKFPFLGFQGERTDGKAYASECIGFRKGNGMLPNLTREVIVWNDTPRTLPASAKKIYFHFYSENGEKKKNCFIYAEDGYLYRFNDDYSLAAAKLGFPETPDCFTRRETNGGEYFVVSGLERTYRFLFQSRTYYYVDSIPPSSAATMHYERMFLVDRSNPDKVLFSKALDMTDWRTGIQDGGYIDLPSRLGSGIGLVSFDGELFFVRERGFTRITARGDNRNFLAKDVELDCGTIRKGSILPCGEYLVFITDRGIFRFNGERAEQIGKEVLFETPISSLTSPAAHGGRYYIGCETRAGRKLSLCIDPATKEGEFLPFYASAFGSSGDELVFLDENNRLCRVKEKTAEDDLLSEWCLRDFSPGERKVMKSLTVRAEGDYVLTVLSGGRVFQKICSGTATVHPNLPGEKFTVKVWSNFVRLYDWEVTWNEY